MNSTSATALALGAALATQPLAADPYSRLPPTASFTVTSTDIKAGEALPLAQLGSNFGFTGKNLSPNLSWKGFPAGTKSFAVTTFDPDAPTPSGFWHWAVANIPATSTGLATGAGNPDGSILPKGAFQLPNDVRMPGYVGATPLPGTGRHRYFFVVHALDIETLPLPKDATPSLLSLVMLQHTLGRGILEVWATAP